jgi:uncharacterized protein
MGYRLERVEGLDGVEPAAWDALVGSEDPFVEHAFLHGLEKTGCVGEGTGWLPRHLLVWDGAHLVGAMPLYEKDHSYGEFIFDWGWARASLQAGIPYYPKLVSAVPFTPVSGRRLLVAPEAAAEAVTHRLVTGAAEIAGAIGARSVHLLFNTAEETQAFEAEGYLHRLSEQLHWENPEGAWADFDDYLAALRSPVRKQVRRERRRAGEHGLSLSLKEGPDLNDAEWASLFRLYERAGLEKSGLVYLNAAFFAHLRAHLAHRVVATFARHGERIVAMALLIRKGTSLYGRYWGTDVFADALHFELCYYRPIEWALTAGIRRFEPGAGGGHKHKRGFMPTACHSLHWLRHPGLADAVARFLPREAEAVEEDMAWGRAHTPFKRGGSGE